MKHSHKNSFTWVQKQSWSDGTGVKALALHVANLGVFPHLRAMPSTEPGVSPNTSMYDPQSKEASNMAPAGFLSSRMRPREQEGTWTMSGPDPDSIQKYLLLKRSVSPEF